MDAKLRELIARNDPDPEVPLHVVEAGFAHRHHTWARTFHSRPELYLQPESLAEIQKIVALARKCRRRVVVVGSAHSPSDITMSSSWKVSLDKFAEVLSVDKEKRTVTVRAGIRLHDLNLRAKEHGLTMPNLGSIDEQSVAGVIATGTHGSSLWHGLLSENVVSLKICLGNAQVVRCSENQNPDLFRAALVSLGALGIVIEVEYRMVPATNIAWVQTIKPLEYLLDNWDKDFWTQAEYTRAWWLPYVHRVVVWRAHKTDEVVRQASSGMISGAVMYHTYHILLWVSHYFPRLVPVVEWFIIGLQHGFGLNGEESAVEEQRNGLLLDCLYSQFVNEWAIPMSKGPEVIRRLDAWLHGDEKAAGIPFSSKGIYVHCPIEVRVSNTTRKEAGPTPYLDFSCRTEPTLYLNAIMYRPYGLEPRCTKRYYQGFEWLMRELGGKPHWAKNFTWVKGSDVVKMYGEDLKKWRRVRAEVDPEGVFVGDWVRRNLLDDGTQERAEVDGLKCEETELRKRRRRTQGTEWVGRQVFEVTAGLVKRSTTSSEESFDHLAGAEAEASTLFEAYSEDGESMDGVEMRMRDGTDTGSGGTPAPFAKF